MRKQFFSGVLSAVILCGMVSGLLADVNGSSAAPKRKPVAKGAGASKKSPKQPLKLVLTVDSSAAPESAEWLNGAAKLMREWYPKICAILKTEHFAPSQNVTLKFSTTLKAPGVTVGKRTVIISSRWIQKHKNDYGMVIHELTHVVQSYRGVKKEHRWLTEGIADYIRCYIYEKRGPIRVALRPQGYKGGYKPAAAFLGWIVKKHDKDFVTEVNSQLRLKRHADGIFKKRTGKDVDELWNEFMKEERARLQKNASPKKPRRKRKSGMKKKD